MLKQIAYIFMFLCHWAVMSGQAVWTVNTTDDAIDNVCNAAHCSLGDAISNANTNAGPDSIIFNIPGAGPHTIQIQPATVLTILDDELVINATSQPGNFPMSGQVVIDGSALTGAADHGLVVYEEDIKIYGLVVQNFPGSGIQVFGGFGGAPPQLSDITIGDIDKGNVITNNGGHGIEGDFADNLIVRGNYIGTDMAFNTGLGNGFDGLLMRMSSGANSLVGGTGNLANYFCSNAGSGINLQIIQPATAWTGQLRLIGNRVGTDASGVLDLGNGSNGLGISGDGALRVGGPGGERNIIAFNAIGILHDSFNAKTLNENQFYCNTGGGIDLTNGANDNIATPSAICVSDGVVNGVADPNVTIEIFDVDTTNCTGPVPCQGNEVIGTTTSDASGFWEWSGPVTLGTRVSVIAIDAMGNTSEFSTCADYVSVVAQNNGPACEGDSIFVEAVPSGNSNNAVYTWYGPGSFTLAGRRIFAPVPGTYKCVVEIGDCILDSIETEVIYNIQTNEIITDFCLGQSWTVNGNTYDENNTVGVEVIVDGNQFGCDSTIFFDLQLNPSIQGRITTNNGFACAGDSVEVTFMINPGTFAPYEVIYTDGTGAIDTIQNVFNGTTITQEVTDDLYFDVIDINSPLTICDPIIGKSDTVLLSNLTLAPQITDYDGFGVSCRGAEDGAIIINATDGVGMLTYDWTPQTLNGDVATGLEGGNYSVTVTDETGCFAVFDTVLTEPPGADPLIEIMEPSCRGAADGVILIDTVFDYEGQLEFSTDSITFTPVNSFPIIIDTLTSGVKTLFFADDSDCVVRSRVIMTRGDIPFVDAGGGKSMIVGDSVQVDFDTDIQNPQILWSPPEIFGCPTCAAPFASPAQTQYVTVSVTNDQGCSGVDSLLIQVFIPKRAFIPNVFTPNGDNINDFFRITGNEYSDSIESIIILNRGGVTVYKQTEIPLGQDSFSWDGTFRGKFLNPGVFTYLVNIRFNDGAVVPFSGTVTLIR